MCTVVLQARTIDDLWVSVQKAFWALTPEQIDNGAHLKTVVCIQNHKAGGGKLFKEAHTGYRVTKRKLHKTEKYAEKRPPQWKELRQHTRGHSGNWVCECMV